MGDKVIFLDSSDSFIVRSIVKSVEGIGHPCEAIDWTVEAIEKHRDEFSDVVVAYINDPEDIDAKSLIFLRDVCVEDNHGLYFIGHESDIDDVKHKYAINNLAGSFFRPVNANEVAENISKMLSDNPLMHRAHILVVDDSGTMLTTIQEWLGEKYRVSVVNSAMNAISFLSKSVPDLILLDYEMPGCSGPQLLEMLRADAHTESIPVIFLTGKDDPESVTRVLSLKPAGYLLKTMPKEYIISQVDNFFEKNKKI